MIGLKLALGEQMKILKNENKTGMKGSFIKEESTNISP